MCVTFGGRKMERIIPKEQSNTIKKKRKKFTSSELQLYSLCLIPVLAVFIFSYLPIGGVIIAFKNYKYNLGIFGSEWVGFKNFEFFFKSDAFARITWNTLFMNAVFIVVATAAAVLVAMLMFYVTSRRATKVYQTILIVPHFISWVVVSYMAYALLNPTYGFVNMALESFGMEPVDWYSNPGPWPFILTICHVWKHIGMNSIYYYAALMGIDTAMFEAAEVDGANKFQIMKSIMLPCLVPIVTILTIMSIGGIFRADFGLFYQVPRNVGLLYKTTDVVDTYIFRTMREVGDMGMSSAVGLLQSVVGLITVLITNAVTKRINPDNALF